MADNLRAPRQRGMRGPGLSAEQADQVQEAIDIGQDAAARADAAAALTGNITATSGEKLPETSVLTDTNGGAVPIIVGGRTVGGTIPIGQSGAGFYVIPRVEFNWEEAQVLTGSTLRFRLAMSATEGFKDTTPFAGNAMRVDMQNGTVLDNAGAALAAQQDGVSLTRDYIYVMTGNERMVGANVQIGPNAPTSAVRSFQIGSLVWDVIAPPANRATTGADAALDVRFAALTPAADIFGQMEPIFQLANGSVAVTDGGGRNVGATVPVGQNGLNTILQWRRPMTGALRKMLGGKQAHIVMGLKTPSGWNRAHTLNMQVRDVDLGVTPVVASNVVDKPISPTRRVISFDFLVPNGAVLDDLRPYLALTDAALATADETIELTDMVIRYYRNGSDLMREAASTALLGDEFTRAASVEQAVSTVVGAGKRVGAMLKASAFVSIGAALQAATALASPGAIAMVDLEEKTYYERSLGLIGSGQDGAWIGLRGKGMGRTIIDGSLPASTPIATIQATSTVDFNGNQYLEKLTIRAKNERYGGHLDSSRFKDDIVLIWREVEIEHLGNDEADAYHGVSVWPSQHPYALGVTSGSVFSFTDCRAKGRRASFSAHDNYDTAAGKGFANPASVDWSGPLTAVTVAGWCYRLESIGSMVMNKATLTQSPLSGDISMAVQPWLPTALEHQPADHRCWELTGHGNSPAVFRIEDFGRALRVTSATSGTGSKAVLSGTAVPLLFGKTGTAGVTYVDGDVGMAGYAYGWADISEDVSNGRPGAITKLGARLGNRTGASVTLTVTVDALNPINVVLNANYTAMSNADIIAAINAVLAGYATISEYNVGVRYRPVFSDEEGNYQNTSGSTIFMGMALARDANGARTVRPMIYADPPSAFAGIAWQDIRPNAFGRVKTRGWIAIDDVLRTGGAPISMGERFTIDADKPGYVRSGQTDGFGILRCVRSIAGQPLTTLEVSPGADVDAAAAIDGMGENEAGSYVLAQPNDDIEAFHLNEAGVPTFYLNRATGEYGMRHTDFEADVSLRASAMFDLYMAEAADTNIIPLEMNELGQVLRWQNRTTLEIFPRLLSSGSTIAYVFLSTGQSNPEGEAGNLASLVRTEYKPAGKLRMLDSAAHNIWQGKLTSAGASVELLASEITGITDLRGAMGDSSHGTTSGEGYVLALSKALQEQYMGFAPEFVLLNNAEGGQTIANLQQTAPDGYFAFKNFVVQLTRLKALLAAEGKRTWFDRVSNQHGESDPSLADLGAQHEILRSQLEAKGIEITGENPPLHMLDWQMSSFKAGQFAGVIDILREHVAQLTGNLRCLHLVGPTYNFRYASDYLHHSSPEHERMGQMEAAVDVVLRKTGTWDVLRILNWSVTGANQITAVMSEAVAIDDAGEVDAIANAGVTLVGGTVSSVAVAGSNLIISTSGAASGVTAVRVALTGHGTDRAQATVPRSNLRSVAAFGRYLDGRPIYKWAVHQSKEA